MQFYGTSMGMDPTLAALKTKTNALIGGINGYNNISNVNPAAFSIQNATNMSATQYGQFGNFGGYGGNPLLPGTSLLNYNSQFGGYNNMNFTGQPNMFMQNNSCDLGKAARGFGKGLILKPLQNMFGTPGKAAMSLGTIGVAAAACACPLTAPVAIPVCAGLAIWGGIQGAVKFLTGAGKAMDAASKGDGQAFEKAFEDVGEGTFNVVGAWLAKRGFKKATGKGPMQILRGTWDDTANAVKNFKLPQIQNPIKNWNWNVFGKQAPATPIATATPAPTSPTVAATPTPTTTPTPAQTTTAAPTANAAAPATNSQSTTAANLYGQAKTSLNQFIQGTKSWFNGLKPQVQPQNQNAVIMQNGQVVAGGNNTASVANTPITNMTAAQAANISLRTQAALYTDPLLAQQQMIQDMMARTGGVGVDPSMLRVDPTLIPPQLQAQFANDPNFQQYLNASM